MLVSDRPAFVDRWPPAAGDLVRDELEADVPHQAASGVVDRHRRAPS
jgi:hypothetical protein